ncbi:MAG: alpha/beta fold hydrolase BchO [Cypionkella sp.]|nr:alpha/beta fold hydrolase BchO [Cypionkella sp.]
MGAPIIPSTWPYRAQSQHIRHAPHEWHVQIMGQPATQSPTLLLLHGAGGASHSFSRLVPLLADDFHLITLDLPGQGFTRLGTRARCALDDMAADIAALMAAQGWAPAAIIGHSAGAAIALRLAEIAAPKAVIGINAALGGFDGVAGWLFPVLARFLSRLPMVPELFSKFAGTPHQVGQLLASTGSSIDTLGAAQYLHLVRQPSHIAATLAMMAQWNLDGLLRRLPSLSLPCLLITASGDRAVPPKVSKTAAARMQNAQVADIPSFGHLVHEEAPEQVARLIHNFLRTVLEMETAICAPPAVSS